MKYLLLFLSLICSLYLTAQENTGLLCGDGIDNDGDGLIDCEDGDCLGLQNDGCATCTDGISFADELLEYQSGCTIEHPNPEGALGVANFNGNNYDERVFLGHGGIIRLGFTNNVLTNGGTPADDLFVFEVGFDTEGCSIALRPTNDFTIAELTSNGFTDPDNDGYYILGGIGGSTAGFDIDGVLPGYAPGELQFDAITLIDDDDGFCGSASTPGADIDAVCALSSIFLDCNGVLNGTFVEDDCGECLDPADPSFNTSCADCAGVPNGTAIIDECGDCLSPSDPLFNAECTDCAGELFGTAVLDDCGVCRQPDDPEFNSTCLDCNEVVNGTAMIDECGECLEPTDPAFNASCADCAGTPNGLAVLDLCGDCYEPTDTLFNAACTDCKGVLLGPAVLDDCGICLRPDDPIFNRSCATPEFFVPNAFSPNNDGVNDRLRGYRGFGSPTVSITCQVFDRWGGLVFSSNFASFQDNSGWWNGLINGQVAPVGVYIYSIVVELENGETVKLGGDALVIR